MILFTVALHDGGVSFDDTRHVLWTGRRGKEGHKVYLEEAIRMAKDSCNGESDGSAGLRREIKRGVRWDQLA